MPKVIDFKTVHGRDANGLEQAVKTALTEGWTPIGGPLLVPATIGVLVVQALVKYESLLVL